MIVGTDGNAYNAADKDNLPAGVTVAGMVAYKDGSNGLVIALADEGNMNWSTAKQTCEGKTAIGSYSWKLPSQNDWKNMFKAFGGYDTSYSGLNDALATAGGESSKLRVGAYWSSTEYTNPYGAWYVTFAAGNAGFGYDAKSEGKRVRACLAF